MSLVEIALGLLSERLGLSREWLGEDIVARALDVALAKVRAEDREAVGRRALAEEGEEWKTLVDEVIVPETWFFRHPEAFEFLATFAKKDWKLAHPTAAFHVLSIPCASGEEPYSVAITLLDAGLDASRIRIDAADASERLLALARLGLYANTSFREKPERFRAEYFVSCDRTWRVRDDVVRLVQFEKANLLDLCRFRERSPYDAIFCRNALIYLNEGARREIAVRIQELLADEGLIFTGSSELPQFCEAGYVPVARPQSFACRKSKGSRSPATAPVAKAAQADLVPRPIIPHDGLLVEAPCAPDSTRLEQAQELAGRGDLDAAASACERLLKEGAPDADVYALLGAISESMGKIEAAEEFFRKALYLAPGHYESLLHMSLVCERRGDVDGAGLYRARAGRALNEQQEKRVLTEI